jgi:hypothetical protein
MTTQQRKWLRVINAGLLCGSALLLIFFCVKGPLFGSRTRELRAEQLEQRTPDEIKKKLLLANEYILTQEALARYSHVSALVMSGVVVLASAANLALTRRGQKHDRNV